MIIKHSNFTIFHKNLFFHGRLGYQWYPVFRMADYKGKNDTKSRKTWISLIAKSSVKILQFCTGNPLYGRPDITDSQVFRDFFPQKRRYQQNHFSYQPAQFDFRAVFWHKTSLLAKVSNFQAKISVSTTETIKKLNEIQVTKKKKTVYLLKTIFNINISSI